MEFYAGKLEMEVKDVKRTKVQLICNPDLMKDVETQQSKQGSRRCLVKKLK